MTLVVYHPEVHNDLREVALFRAEIAGVDSAQAYISKIYDFCDDMGVYPDAGRNRRYGPYEVQTRTFQKRHVVVYVHENGVVQVLEVHSTWIGEDNIERRVGQRLRSSSL